jgi:hypothetical protein
MATGRTTPRKNYVYEITNGFNAIGACLQLGGAGGRLIPARSGASFRAIVRPAKMSGGLSGDPINDKLGSNQYVY